ncbi:MAG: IPT/TIG domain-containing protein [Terriglobales bacterium]
MTTSGLPSGLSVTPASFTLQNAAQTVTMTASNSLADGTYGFTFNGTSGSLNESTKVNVGVGPLQGFTLFPPTVIEVLVTFGSMTSAQFQVSGPSSYLLSFSAQGLPSGVTASFSPNPVNPGTPGTSTTLTLTGPTNGQWLQNVPFDVVATPTASVPAQTVTMVLELAPPPGNLPSSRSDYVRTDDAPQSIVYDSAHQLIFSSSFYLNRVDAVSPTTKQIVKSIPVMSPRGLALTLDGGEVLVGSDAQQIVAVSTATLQVVNQWKLPRISGDSHEPQNLYALPDGTVAIQLVDANSNSPQLAIWDPTKNAISVVTLPAQLANDPCFVSGTADGATLIVASCVSPSGAAIYDAATKAFTATVGFTGYVYGVAANRDGSRFIIFNDVSGISLYNNQFQRLAYVPAAGYISGFIFSPDGSRIYVAGAYGVPIIFVSDGSTAAFISTAPAVGTIPPGAQIYPSPFVGVPFAADTTGLVFSSAEHGIAFNDSAYPVNYLLGFNATPEFAKTVTPDYGPVNTATPVSFPQGQGFGAIPDVWFGEVRGTQAALGSGGILTVTAPPSAQSGPVNVKVMGPDGTPIFDPLAFSYAPYLMFVNGDIATPAGGATSDIVGIGLPADPSQVQVTVGGKNAAVVSATIADFQNPSFPFSYPYPAVDVKVTLPPGSGDQDVQVFTSAGTATLAKAIHYAQSVADYGSADVFHAILLDRKRNQLYLSAGDHIDVFSLTTLQFLSPIAPPALNGQKEFHGMALTPDGSELLAANFPDGSVALINPDKPSAATAVQVISPGTFGNPGAENVATTNAGKAFIEAKALQVVGCGGNVYELDLSTLQVTALNYLVDGFCIQDEGFALAASGDGSRVLATTTDLGPQNIAAYDVASNSWSANHSVPEAFGGNAAISADGSVLATGSGIVSPAADVLGYLARQDVFESTLGFSLPLEKVPDGGSLVYVAYPNSIDIFDVNHGALLHRLTLKEQVQQVTDAMAIDSYGQNIYLITNAGLTVVQLGNAPLAIGHLTPSAGPVGTNTTIHGSGFRQTTSVTANGSAATATFVDPNTLQMIVPSGASGSVQITVTNPSSRSYSLDNAFTVQ